MAPSHESVTRLACDHGDVHDAALLVDPADGEDVLLAATTGPVNGLQLRIHIDRLGATFSGRIVLVDQIVRDGSGKLAADGPEFRVGYRFDPPRPGLETELAAIWADVLRLDRVGATDDFTDLGGDSLAAVLVADRVFEDLGRTISVPDIYDAGTVRELVDLVQSANKPAGLQ
jgi:acyl carrier protein